MPKVKTNPLEIVFRKALVGETIYDDDGNSIVVADVNYVHSLRTLFVKDNQGNEVKINLDTITEAEVGEIDQVKPKKRLKGKRKRWS